MPIFMDRHDLSPEVTAEIVADLHQKDLGIQDQFNCKGLAYWFDDKRKTAFCLIEAPNKAAIQKMHDQAHGEVPNCIIEVDNTVVEFFLGRIEDPKKSQKTRLNIINDLAFRTIMAIGVRPISLKERLKVNLNSTISGGNKTILNLLNIYKGRVVKQNQNHYLVSFDSVTNAVLCALEAKKKLKNSFTQKDDWKLNVGLSAGVPVDENENFFEQTIKAACSYYEFVQGIIVLSSEVKELYESENFNISIDSSIVALNPAEEKFIKKLLNFTGGEWNNASLTIDDFCQYLGFSKSGFYRRIVALTGKSPNTFLKEYRLKRALELLKKRDMNISEIASETGFNSAAYFSKCFQETIGVLPSHYVRS